ncbi:ABC transporter permease [Natronogracilivirga saccharolytica]|uniref:ABC transporter permease n=1 Tax=Natronogracilivirga saccharolytica TaxID=2812953 RepID=A0A8J7RJB2_9BACT|nr:ABC transporter permease [Natronogracilivirga saccharolytica]MBP3191223.1 ABC transporter permease [Natronogracilivirga saccharolytica]
MNLWQIIKMAFGALGSNKTRASLTLLAIVVGVFAVISASTAVRVIDNYFQNTMTLMGSDVINITTRPTVMTGHDQSHARRQPITFRHYEQLREMSELARAISPEVNLSSKRIYQGNSNTEPNVTVWGGNEYSLANNAYDIEEGRNFTRDDIEHARPYAIIGADIRSDLFSGSDPAGKRIRIDGQHYTVIGVVESKGSAFGQSLDNFVLLPYSRLASVYGRDHNINLQIRAPSVTLINETVDEATGLLRVIRQVPPDRGNDFEIETNESLRGIFDDFTGILYLFGFVVGGIALLGAGIGVMNIMLVSVTERTREIGIRKAVGANRKNITIQFMTEAIIVCQLGGLIGMFLGIAAGNILVVIMGTTFVLPVLSIVAGIAGMTLIGMIFGVYPAWKAARLDPIESLRFE